MDREAASIPLADRVEWAVYSLLSTAGPIAETAFFERVAALFPGHDLPDETFGSGVSAAALAAASTVGAFFLLRPDLRELTFVEVRDWLCLNPLGQAALDAPVA